MSGEDAKQEPQNFLEYLRIEDVSLTTSGAGDGVFEFSTFSRGQTPPIMSESL